MRTLYRGIDIAGDQGETGFVDLIDDGDGRLRVECVSVPLTGEEGIGALIRTEPGDRLAAAAIDQPLGFPAGTLRLLACPETVEGIPPYDAVRASYREADLAMCADLDGLNANYVRPPVVCANVWRALHLLRAAGADIRQARRGICPWFETHPRLCVVRLVRHAGAPNSLVEQYKVKGLSSYKTYCACKPCLDLLARAKRLPSSLPKVRGNLFHAALHDHTRRAELSGAVSAFAAAADPTAADAVAAYEAALRDAEATIHARQRCLDLLGAILPLHITPEVLVRLLDIGDSNTFEALFCAVAAYAEARGAVWQYPASHPREADIELEGLVFAPDYAKLRDGG